jgi:LysR family transcriptional regulator (chromosome initiation inhibitor)
VMGAVTTERRPVPGCRVYPLGAMRYVPVATAGYVERYLPDGFTAAAVAHAPSLAWNRDDALQDSLVRKVFRKDIARPTHSIPTAEGFAAAVRAGLGWGMFPEELVDESWVPVAPQHLDVPLYWQCWKLDSVMVSAITDTVRSAAASLRARR